jgi:hypothetical protein
MAFESSSAQKLLPANSAFRWRKESVSKSTKELRITKKADCKERERES